MKKQTLLLSFLFFFFTLSSAQVLKTGPVSPEIYGVAWLGIVFIFTIDYLRKVLVKRLRVGEISR